jgi:hypothetical protein
MIRNNRFRLKFIDKNRYSYGNESSDVRLDYWVSDMFYKKAGLEYKKDSITLNSITDNEFTEKNYIKFVNRLNKFGNYYYLKDLSETILIPLVSKKIITFNKFREVSQSGNYSEFNFDYNLMKLC